MFIQKRIITTLIALLLLFATGPNMVKATEPIGIMPLYLNIDYARASLSISSGTATCTANVSGLLGTTKIVGSVYLQRRLSSSTTYSTIRTWSGNISNGSTFSFSGIHAVSSGYIYRVKLDAIVTRNGVNETVTVYSALRSY